MGTILRILGKIRHLISWDFIDCFVNCFTNWDLSWVSYDLAIPPSRSEVERDYSVDAVNQTQSANPTRQARALLDKAALPK